jgi:hypothetical protein
VFYCSGKERDLKLKRNTTTYPLTNTNRSDLCYLYAASSNFETKICRYRRYWFNCTDCRALTCRSIDSAISNVATVTRQSIIELRRSRDDSRAELGLVSHCAKSRRVLSIVDVWGKCCRNNRRVAGYTRRVRPKRQEHSSTLPYRPRVRMPILTLKV